MLVTVIADGIAMLLSPSSIMTEKLVRRGLHIEQDYESDVLQEVTVSEVMDRNAATVPPQMTVRQLADRVARRDPEAIAHQGHPIVDSNGCLLGIITRSDVLRALDKDASGRLSVLDAGHRDPVVAYPDELLYDAVARMLRHDIGRLPVVSREDPRCVIGYLGRSQVMTARARRLENEYVREPGWIHRRFLP
jgi:CBS domain-containing protein